MASWESISFINTIKYLQDAVIVYLDEFHAGYKKSDGTRVEDKYLSFKTVWKPYFKKYIADTSRFFKMDLYSRLAYISTTLLAKDLLDGSEPEDRALFIFTQNGSVLADRKHLSTFSDPEAFFPSPAVFINTLPNVVLGEIAVRNVIKGETTLVMLPGRDDAAMDGILEATLSATRPAVMLCGWVDCAGEDIFMADLKLLKIKQ